MTEWVPIRLPKYLFDEVTRTISRTGFWINELDFVRDAVREKLACELNSQKKEATA